MQPRPASNNPIVAILNVIGIAVFVGISIMLGFIVIAIVLGLGALLAGYLGFQRFRFNRKKSKIKTRSHETVIEGEYKVISDEQKTDQ